MKGRGQAGFTIPVTMLMVSVLMVLSTAIVAMTVASFRDAARTRNRAEILNVSEIGLKLAIAEIMPGLGTMPNAYWSFVATENANPASASADKQAPSRPGGKDRTHEFQLFANVRNWSPFADWTAWDSGKTYAQNHANPDWSKGWWMVPRNENYDDAYYGEDANGITEDKDNNVYTSQVGKAGEWTFKNPDNDTPAGRAQLAFPVRLGTSSVPVRNLYWYWLTEIKPNTPTNTMLRARGLGGLPGSYWINSPPKFGPPIDAFPRAERDVGIGAWQNRVEYRDGLDSAAVNYDNGNTSFSLRNDRYNFLNTPVLKKIYTVDHRGTKIRVAVYVRMILREYFIDSDKSDYPDNFLTHMRTERPGGGPNVIFYLVAVNESTPMQRGVRVQQAIYVPMGPANPQDLDATVTDASIDYRFADNDGRMFPGTFDLLMDKKLMTGATISGTLMPASGDLSYRIPTTQAYNVPADQNTHHPHWVYLIEWNGIDKPWNGNEMSSNSALIWRVPGTNFWRRTPFRNPDGTASITGAVIAGNEGTGATPSAYADVSGFFQIGHSTDRPFIVDPALPLVGETGWRGPGMDAWGRTGHPPASMSYLMMTELNVPNQMNSDSRFSLYVTATRSNEVIPPDPEP